MGVSGGVDSLVASVLISKATSKLYCVFVDHGLIRKNEKEEVEKLYKTLGFESFFVVDAADLFLSRLKDVSNPEEKRKLDSSNLPEDPSGGILTSAITPLLLKGKLMLLIFERYFSPIF